MKQIVTEVLQAEEAINARLKEVRREAAKVTAAAEKEVAANMAEAQEESRLIVQHAIEEARVEAERLRNERLAEADLEKETLMTGQTDAIDRLVNQICETLLGSDGEPTE